MLDAAAHDVIEYQIGCMYEFVAQVGTPDSPVKHGRRVVACRVQPTTSDLRLHPIDPFLQAESTQTLWRDWV